MSPRTTEVPARTGLAGHPSDAFGGAVLAAPVPELSAVVSVEPAEEIVVGDLRFGSLESLCSAPHEGGSKLLTAAIARLVAWLDERGTARPSTGFELLWQTSIPRYVGLAGSSALVIAALRSLSELWEVDIPDDIGPRLALEVETDLLGIAAGPQDRIVQWHGATVLMELGGMPWSVTEVRPPAPVDVLVCWTNDSTRPSHATHAPLQARRSEPVVGTRMRELAVLARRAAAALAAADFDALGHCMDESFEHRRALVPLEPEHVALVEGLRALGAAVTYTGSGGAVVALAPDLEPLRRWARAHDLGCVATTLA